MEKLLATIINKEINCTFVTQVVQVLHVHRLLLKKIMSDSYA